MKKSLILGFAVALALAAGMASAGPPMEMNISNASVNKVDVNSGASGGALLGGKTSPTTTSPGAVGAAYSLASESGRSIGVKPVMVSGQPRLQSVSHLGAGKTYDRLRPYGGMLRTLYIIDDTGAHFKSIGAANGGSGGITNRPVT